MVVEASSRLVYWCFCVGHALCLWRRQASVAFCCCLLVTSRQCKMYKKEEKPRTRSDITPDPGGHRHKRPYAQGQTSINPTHSQIIVKSSTREPATRYLHSYMGTPPWGTRGRVCKKHETQPPVSSTLTGVSGEVNCFSGCVCITFPR